MVGRENGEEKGGGRRNPCTYKTVPRKITISKKPLSLNYELINICLHKINNYFMQRCKDWYEFPFLHVFSQNYVDKNKESIYKAFLPCFQDLLIETCIYPCTKHNIQYVLKATKIFSFLI